MLNLLCLLSMNSNTWNFSSFLSLSNPILSNLHPLNITPLPTRPCKKKKKKKTFVLSSSSLLLYACTEKKKLFFFCIYSFFKLLSIFLSFSLCPWFSHSPPRLYCFLFNLLLYGNSSLFLHPFPHSDFFYS